MPNGHIMSREKMTNGRKKELFFEQSYFLRKICGSTIQKDFAKKLGISLRAYSRYEKGEREMPNGLVKFALLLTKDKEEVVLIDESLSLTDEGSSIKEYIDNFKMELEVITNKDAERQKAATVPASNIDTSNQPTMSYPVETPGGTFSEDVECLRKIYNYGDIGIISAIHQNLKTFVRTVAQDNEIQKLKAENAEIRKRLELLEQKLSTDGRGKVEDADAAQAAAS